MKHIPSEWRPSEAAAKRAAPENLRPLPTSREYRAVGGGSAATPHTMVTPSAAVPRTSHTRPLPSAAVPRTPHTMTPRPSPPPSEAAPFFVTPRTPPATMDGTRRLDV